MAAGVLRLVIEGVAVADGRVKVETVIPTDQDVKLRNVRGEPVEPCSHCKRPVLNHTRACYELHMAARDEIPFVLSLSKWLTTNGP